MAKKMKTKTSAKRATAKKSTVKSKVRRASARSVSKYDQPGAPWWKKALPLLD